MHQKVANSLLTNEFGIGSKLVYRLNGAVPRQRCCRSCVKRHSKFFLLLFFFVLSLATSYNARRHNVFYSASSTEIIDGLVESLKNRTNANSSSLALDALVTSVAGVQIWEHKNGSTACNQRAWHLYGSNFTVHGAVVLDGPFNQKVL